MEIIEITESVSHYVTTDEKHHSEFRRNGPDAWERLYGETWESVTDCTDLEAAFQVRMGAAASTACGSAS